MIPAWKKLSHGTSDDPQIHPGCQTQDARPEKRPKIRSKKNKKTVDLTPQFCQIGAAHGKRTTKHY